MLSLKRKEAIAYECYHCTNRIVCSNIINILLLYSTKEVKGIVTVINYLLTFIA